MSHDCKDSRKSVDKLFNNSKFVSLVKQIVNGTPDAVPAVIVPPKVAKKMLPGEKVLFTGGYLRSDAAYVNDLTLTLSSKVSTNPGGYNLLSALTWVVNDTMNAVNFCNERYTISAWDRIPTLPDRVKVGQIEWAGVYNNEQGGTTTEPDVERFFVTGAYGIFEGVTGVLVDYKADLTRTIYYISQ